MTVITDEGESIFTPSFQHFMNIYFELYIVFILIAIIFALRDMRKKAKEEKIPLWKECLKTYLYYGTFHFKKKDDD